MILLKLLFSFLLQNPLQLRLRDRTSSSGSRLLKFNQLKLQFSSVVNATISPVTLDQAIPLTRKLKSSTASAELSPSIL